MPAVQNVQHDFLLAVLADKEKALMDLFHKYHDKIDWNWVLDFSKTHKVRGIILNSLDKFGITFQLPDELQKEIRAIQRDDKERLIYAGLTIQQIRDVFQREEIPFIVFKGSIYSEEYYDAPHVRPFHDLDLLVYAADLLKAEAALKSIGYKFHCPPVQQLGFTPIGKSPKEWNNLTFSEEITKQLYLRYHYHYPYVLPDSDKRLSIDLHWNLFSPGTLDINARDFWNYTKESHISYIPVRTLTPEVSLVYLATKIALIGTHGLQFMTLYDFHQHLKKFNSDNWDTIWKIVEKWNVKREFLFSLRFVRKIFDDNSFLFKIKEDKSDSGSNICFALVKNESAFVSMNGRTIIENIIHSPRHVWKKFCQVMIQLGEKIGLLRHAAH